MRKGFLTITACLLLAPATAFCGAVAGGSGMTIEEQAFKDLARESIDGSRIEVDGIIYEPSQINVPNRRIDFTNPETGERLTIYSDRPLTGAGLDSRSKQALEDLRRSKPMVPIR